jgi:hypothetical protein
MAANDPDVVAGGWVTYYAGRFGRLGRIVRSSSPPAREIVENWPRPRKYAGPLVPVIGLVGASSSDGWDIAPRELRFFQKELADELVKTRKARPAKPHELPADE